MAFNVLVVDDSAVMRAMIIRTLRLGGVPVGEVYQAANGAEGLRVLAEQWVDLALLDINMPVMDGEEMIDRMRSSEETASLPVVVVSTEGSDTRIEALRRKGVEFVHKPFAPEVLRDTIIRITGVSDVQERGEAALPGGGCDF